MSDPSGNQERRGSVNPPLHGKTAQRHGWAIWLVLLALFLLTGCDGDGLTPAQINAGCAKHGGVKSIDSGWAAGVVHCVDGYGFVVP